MSHPRLIILGYSEAAMFLRNGLDDLSGIISIHGRREFDVQAEGVHRLDLTFDDVDVPDANDPLGMQRALARRRWAELNGLVEIPPTEADAAAIIEFARRVGDMEGALLCHCSAGISRSPAAALICLATWRGPGCEAQCAKDVRTIRRGAVPHVGLVRFADRLLNRGEKLVGALKGSG